eukprot:1897002-Karenia_brevis.AAC.1
MTDPEDRILLDVWNRTGTTGRGKEVLERKTKTESLLCFFAEDERLLIPRAQKFQKFQSKNDKKAEREQRSSGRTGYK